MGVRAAAQAGPLPVPRAPCRCRVPVSGLHAYMAAGWRRAPRRHRRPATRRRPAAARGNDLRRQREWALRSLTGQTLGGKTCEGPAAIRWRTRRHEPASAYSQLASGTHSRIDSDSAFESYVRQQPQCASGLAPRARSQYRRCAQFASAMPVYTKCQSSAMLDHGLLLR
eukprot:COSAG02_NODE_6229_length_3711_cov_49.018549_4_plen_169_part_00